MSKRDLKKYLSEMSKEQVSEQIIDLYEKFADVKTYYDFVFNPKEDKLVQAAKLKIANEYFPVKSKRPKLRRSTAQKIIKQFLVLGVDPHAVADVMLYTIETAIKYSARREMKYASFYKSLLTAFEQAVKYINSNLMMNEFEVRVMTIFHEVERQGWDNLYEFERVLDRDE